MTEKQGCGDEGETGETRREVRKDPEMGVHGRIGRSGGDPGKIHRSWGFGVQECRRKYREGDKVERTRGGLGGGKGEDKTRTMVRGGVLGERGG